MAFVLRFALRLRFLGLWVLLICVYGLAASAQEMILTHEATDTRYTVRSFIPANISADGGALPAGVAHFPVGMVFTPDGRLLYNEKITGQVRVVSAEGELLPPILELPTDALQERGMLGIQLDPNFEENGYVYLVHTLSATSRDYPAWRLIRFTLDAENTIGEIEELWRLPIDNGLLLHYGGNIQFDDAGRLLVSVGDFGEAENAQNLDTPQGALHRFEMTSDGELMAAEGNPFGDDNSILAYGLRNTFDFVIDPMSGTIFGGESGPECDDEINTIYAGFNYGWGEDYDCVGLDTITGLSDIYLPPMLTYTPTIAPTGIIVYDGEMFPEWEGDLFFCEWNNGILRRVELNENRNRAQAVHEIDLGDVSCRLDLTLDNTGALVFGTLIDGRGGIFRLARDGG